MLNPDHKQVIANKRKIIIRNVEAIVAMHYKLRPQL